MATVDLGASFRSMGTEEKLVAMALGVLQERISRLSQADRDDLFALVLQMRSATDEADLDGIAQTMIELLDGGPHGLERANLADEETPAHQKWMEFVSKRVREARTEAGLTQIQLAERSGLPQSHISRIETAKLSPSRVTIEKIATALGLPVASFDVC